MESKANKIISEKIEEEDLTCQPTELNKADVKGHCRSVADKVFQEGIQSRNKEILEIIDKDLSKGEIYIPELGMRIKLQNLTGFGVLKALRDKVVVEK